MTALIATKPIFGGPITLSDRRTQRRWTVDVAPFRLAPTPVTQADFWAVTGRQPSAQTGSLHPVEQVSWWDAALFRNALSEREGLTPVYLADPETEQVTWLRGSTGYRLPTEAE
ncbi:hypothetical protein GCM10017783_18170 [Deinococcus piscis]|uniref:Sulfatase-modifying factor enzyme-like domain-containing protein n=1 Tax=Deinococcus piscis TaxID=394230 RepID=A0ABQ3K754_9DEIO|nr:hypothetical protein GCM10017783_18170 [Deinococcus piscis]